MWEAAVAAGATLDELCRLDDGGYSKQFLVKLLAWKHTRDLVRIHSEDAVARAAKRKAKRSKR